jgi:hypothetical protein
VFVLSIEQCDVCHLRRQIVPTEQPSARGGGHRVLCGSPSPTRRGRRLVLRIVIVSASLPRGARDLRHKLSCNKLGHGKDVRIAERERSGIAGALKCRLVVWKLPEHRIAGRGTLYLHDNIVEAERENVSRRDGIEWTEKLLFIRQRFVFGFVCAGVNKIGRWCIVHFVVGYGSRRIGNARLNSQCGSFLWTGIHILGTPASECGS